MFAEIAAWAAGKLGGIGGKALELIIALVLLIVLVGGPYWLGMRHQFQADQLAQAKALAAQQAANDKALDAARARGDALVTKLDAAKASTRVVYRTITKEIPHVVTVYRPSPDAALRPLPRAVFTVGFVGLWNDALDPGLPGASGSAADAPGTRDPALDSGLSESDILENHTENSKACEAVRKQLGALIEWHREMDRK